MEELQHLSNGNGRTLARVNPRGDLPAPASLTDPTQGGVKREYAGVLEYWQMVRRHKMAVAVRKVLKFFHEGL